MPKGMENCAQYATPYKSNNSSVSTFLDRSVLDLAAKDKLGSPLKASLLCSILALGAYLLGDESQPTSPVYNPQTLLKAAMELRLKFARQDEFSIRHLQVLNPEVRHKVKED